MLAGKLDFKAIQDKWVKEWPDELYKFKGDLKKEPFIIDSPPPFPTGEFHAGHVLNWCYIDFTARFKRMNGFDVLFPQGWDCHGFPTEVKVEKKYGKKLSRQEFYAKCIEWSHEVIASMKSQMHELGLSIDWSKEYKTIDDEYKAKVQLSVLKMFGKGLVYKGNAPVLWCTHCKSAIAKAETEELDKETLLNYLNFKTPLGQLPIATTRPELLHACVAVAIHPGDERYKNLNGEKATTPLGKEVPIIIDADVDKDFGSGAVMICSFGDKQDVIWINRHNLPVIQGMSEDGKIINSELTGGLKAKDAREKLLELFKEKKVLTKQEKIKQTVKIHDRCKHEIELLESIQWFIKLKDKKEYFIDIGNKMYWYPSYYHQTYNDWVNGLEWDWCISRQRIFGIPLPFWTCDSCGKIIPASEKELPIDPTQTKKKCRCGENATGVESVFDGWIDSSITPLIVTGWPKDSFKDYYPTTMRPQGSDIIRTWAFYTAFRCFELTGQPPFKDIVINGMVTGQDGKKMSKSLGNYIEAKDVLKKYGADALRQWAALAGATGKDNAFRLQDLQYAQAFITKLWNASKFVSIATSDYEHKKAEKTMVDKWILAKLNEANKKATACLKEYDYYGALTAIQAFFWHDYCDYYLEDVKYRIYDDKNKQAAQATLKEVLDTSLKLLAPFAPFITEEVYSQTNKKSIHSTEWPAANNEDADKETMQTIEDFHKIVSIIRQFKTKNNVSLSTQIETISITGPETQIKRLADVIEDLKGVLKASNVNFKEGEELTAEASR
ncbi:MAG: valine--tRNA ligase [Candidatus Micrarchaeota archaeon]